MFKVEITENIKWIKLFYFSKHLRRYELCLVSHEQHTNISSHQWNHIFSETFREDTEGYKYVKKKVKNKKSTKNFKVRQNTRKNK